MAPIRLKTWVPRNTKPAWDRKAKKSEELSHFDVPFAIKEYVQNVVGQILKDLHVRAWGAWDREDLRGKTAEERDVRKRWLMDSYPGLLTGPHGVSLRHKDCLPLYILSAQISVPLKTNLMVAIVLWTTGGAMNALTFFNNHLDANATFESFAVDGESTSKTNQWAVGEKGKGFILATQYLAEQIDEAVAAKATTVADPPPRLQLANGKPAPNAFPPGLSFRVGEQIGELKWKKSRKVGSADSLRLILDDLTTRTVSEYLPHRYHRDIDDAPDGGVPEVYEAAMETAKMRDKAATILKQAQKNRIKYGLDGPNNKSVVNADEVCITVIGVDVGAQPEYLFSAIYGIMPPPRQWFAPGRNVEFFFADGDTPKFYHRDQLVKDGIHLNRLSINYSGNLTLSSDRVSVRNDWQMNHYRRDVRNTMDWAFRTLPESAVELALDILTDDHSNALAGILVPNNKAGKSEYKVAFDTAMCQRRRSAAPTTLPLHPYAGSDENLKLFSELGLTPFKVSHNALNIMHQSGAYAPVTEYARNVLLSSPPISDFPGLDRLRAALQSAVPSVPLDSITVRKYDKLYPTVIWDDENKHFAFAFPKACEDHPEAQCLCWIGPVLHDASKEYKGPTIPARKLWRAFAVEMGGDTTVKSVASEKPNGSHPNPTSTTSQSAQKTSTKSQVSTTGSAVQDSTGNLDEATSNMLALAQLSKTILGYDVFKKCDAMASNFAAQQKHIEDLSSASGAKDGRIMELEEENKDLREDLAYYEDGAAARRAKREFKRQKTA